MKIIPADVRIALIAPNKTVLDQPVIAVLVIKYLYKITVIYNRDNSIKKNKILIKK